MRNVVVRRGQAPSLPVLLSAACIATLLLVATGCGTAPDTTAPNATDTTTPGSGTGEPPLLSADVPRSTPEAKPVEIQELVSGNTAFAVDLLRSLAAPSGAAAEENLVISPYSISVALAMTYAGARDDTATEMAETLHFTLPADRLHAAFNSLGQTIATRSREIPPANDGDEPATVELSVVNQLWAQQGFTFLTEYLETLAAQYGAGLRTVDFIADAEAARQTINDWVAQVTKDRIKDLLPEGSLGDLTRLVLTNAVYLKAPWAVPFEKSMTQDGDFHLAGGGTVTAAFMQQSETLGYAQTTDWTAVQLPYKGGELAMVVLLPAAANASGAVADLSSAVADLDGAALQGLLSALQNENVTLSLPKFTATSALSLGDVLQSLGMDLSFSDDADFSGMTGSRDLTIDSVFHNGFVAVDEDGTEAAAATAVVMRLKAAPAEPKTVVVDRPFIWLLRDIETGTILFLGQVTDPTQE